MEPVLGEEGLGRGSGGPPRRVGTQARRGGRQQGGAAGKSAHARKGAPGFSVGEGSHTHGRTTLKGVWCWSDVAVIGVISAFLQMQVEPEMHTTLRCPLRRHVCVCGAPYKVPTAQGPQRGQGWVVSTQNSHLLTPSSSHRSLPRTLWVGRCKSGWCPVQSPYRCFPLELPAPPVRKVCVG